MRVNSNMGNARLGRILPGHALTVSTPPVTSSFIDHADTLAMRSSLVASHGLGSDPVAGFTGIADTTGFTEYVCTTGEQFYTALTALASTVTTRKLIRLQWNGPQGWASTSQINGPGTAALASYANAAEFCGYNLPIHATKIVADPGYSPVFSGSGIASGELNINGFGKIDIQGVTFEKPVMLSYLSSRNIAPLFSASGCTFKGKLTFSSCRVAHLANCVFDGAALQISSKSLHTRIWDCEIKNKTKDGDSLVFTGFGAAFSGRPVHVWIAGNVMHSSDSLTTSANHFDFLQYGLADELYASFNVLGEFNLVNCNLPVSQGVFGDASGADEVNNQLWHNNLVLINAFHAMRLKDPSGTGVLRWYRNTVLRAALGNNGEVDDTKAQISIFKATAAPVPTTGVYDIRENYHNGISIGTDMGARTTQTGNVLVDPNPGFGNSIQTLLTGNGTFALNSSGRGAYTDPGYGLSKAAAKTAMRNFFMPIGGYRVAGAGMTDPANWPVAGAAW